MTDNKINIQILEKNGPLPYDLLLLADPSRSCIDQYIKDSEIYLAFLDGEAIGCYALYKSGDKTAEIKNIAVDEKYQGKGIGTRLLQHAIAQARQAGFQQLVIGTGNSSTWQLHLYQKMGFRITGTIPDFFRQNYAEPIIENGIECRDMVVLTMRF